ncbi:MAG: glycosyltransferase, partial [Chloroflexi bacterium]|nr:glycosyltransferase [Chloroflexota bacterium]
YSVDLVLAQARGLLLEQVPSKVKIVDLQSSRILTSPRALARYLREKKPAVMLSALTHANLSAIWARSLSGGRVRLVVSERRIISLEQQTAPRIERIFPYLIRLFYPWADGIVTVSNYAADDLSKQSGILRSHVQVIHNPAYFQDLEELAREDIDHPWFELGQPPVLLAVGRLEEPKDYSTLLHAFAILRKRRVVRLLIIGDGSKRSQILSLIGDLGLGESVIVMGYLTNPYPFMLRSSVIVHSSRWESFCNVLVEAMACRTQVVATDCPGAPAEILQYGKYGRLVPVGDAAAMAAAIEIALDHPIPAEDLHARASQFSLEKISRQYLRLLFPDSEARQGL